MNLESKKLGDGFFTDKEGNGLYTFTIKDVKKAVNEYRAYLELDLLYNDTVKYDEIFGEFKE